MQGQGNQNEKYKLKAQIGQLFLNKKLNFQTKIIWKRNVNKTQTNSVLHENCLSTFNESLELQLNLLHNAEEKKFEPKFTQFSIIVIYQGKVKSGGYVKFDAAEIVNKNYVNEKIRFKILQCPDPEAYLDIVFNYESIEEASRSLYNQLSMLNPIGMDLDLSQIDFQENEQIYRRVSSQKRNSGDNIITDLNNIQIRQQRSRKSQQYQENKQISSDQKENIEVFKQKEIYKISNILDKFQSITRKIKTKESFFKDDASQTKIDNLLQISIIPTEQEQKYRLKIIELQRQLSNRDQLIEQYQKQLQENKRTIEQLQIKLQLSVSRHSEREERGEYNNFNNIQYALAQSESKYRMLYEQTLSQLEEIKHNIINDANFSKQNVKFKNFVDQINEVHQINEIPEFDHIQQCGSKQKDQKFQMLQRQNLQLQTKVASISHNIARIFNAAHDFGGSKLLDYLQNSIGLIES